MTVNGQMRRTAMRQERMRPRSGMNRSSQKGRPSGAEDRHLWDGLLRAAEQCLTAKSPDELTRREIAAAAGTNSAMIGYYFESKEGLFRTILARLMCDMEGRIRELGIALTANPEQPTRRLVEGLCAAYQANAGACRILAVELTKASSAIKRTYISRDAALIVDYVTALLTKLAAQGVYRPEADLRKVAVTIRLLVTHQLFGPPAWSLLEAANGARAHEAWLEHVVDMLDRQLNPRRR